MSNLLLELASSRSIEIKLIDPETLATKASGWISRAVLKHLRVVDQHPDLKALDLYIKSPTGDEVIKIYCDFLVHRFLDTQGALSAPAGRIDALAELAVQLNDAKYIMCLVQNLLVTRFPDFEVEALSALETLLTTSYAWQPICWTPQELLEKTDPELLELIRMKLEQHPDRYNLRCLVPKILRQH